MECDVYEIFEIYLLSTPPRFSQVNHEKRKGSAILAVVVVCGIVCSLMTMSMAKATQSNTNSTLSNGKTLQAQSYAVGKIDLLRSTDYSDLKSEGKTAISGTDFFQEVTLSSESNYTDSIKQKTATVKVYKGQETIPRAEIKLTRYSAEQKASGVPIGTVIAWPGTKNPTDGTWLECNGQSCAGYAELVSVLGKSTVPDYRNRFLEGSATPNQVIEAGLPNIIGSFNVSWRNNGTANGASGAFTQRPYYGADWSSGSGSTHMHEYTLDASKSSSIYGKSTTVQPPAVTVKYLIKAA